MLAVFDIGSTLVVPSAARPAARIAEALELDESNGRELNRALMTRMFSEQEMVVAFLSDALGVASHRAMAAVAEVWSSQEQEAQPVPGASEMLATLAESGVQLALLSNIWHPYLVSVRRYFGDTFDLYIPPSLQFFSYREGRMKPERELFGRLLETAGVPADRAVMVGDSYLTDLQPAMEVGMKTVWVLARPDHEVGNIIDVINGTMMGPTHTTTAVTSLSLDLLDAVLE